MNSSATSIYPESADIRVDSISHGIVLMLVLTVVQRSMGFVRNVLICRLMDPAELGNWNLAFSFLETVAPLVVLGIPGCFTRYVEHFRQRHQMLGFLKKTTGVTVAFVAIGTTIICWNLDAVSWLAFGSSEFRQMLVIATIVLILVIAFNFCVEILTALRQVRSTSYLQFLNSLVFTLCSTLLLLFTNLGTLAVLIGYGVACFISSIVAVLFLRTVLSGVSRIEKPLPHKMLWFRIAPFIAWYWLTDFFTNAFSTVDRLMIVHCSGVSDLEAKTMIGQYHSSRIIGILLIAIVGLLSGILLSYVSHEWELGRKSETANRLDFALKLVGLCLTGIANVSLIGSPVIFGWALGGKYDEGLQVLPQTLAYCSWFSLIFVAANFVWCHEKPFLMCFTVGLGLASNVTLNYFWLPTWGLNGAIAATTVANLIGLVATCVACRCLGMRFSRGTMVAIALPGTLCLGVLPSTAFLLAVLWSGCASRWLFSVEETQQLKELAKRFMPNT